MFSFLNFTKKKRKKCLDALLGFKNILYKLGKLYRNIEIRHGKRLHSLHNINIPIVFTRYSNSSRDSTGEIRNSHDISTPLNGVNADGSPTICETRIPKGGMTGHNSVRQFF